VSCCLLDDGHPRIAQTAPYDSLQCDKLALRTDAACISLQTAKDNAAGQALYKQHGYHLDEYLTFVKPFD